MKRQTAKDLIRNVELLKGGETVRFEDEDGNIYNGEVTETDPNLYGNHSDFIIEKENGRTVVLQLQYSRLSVPTHVTVSSDNGPSKRVIAIEVSHT